jgi:tetratricopeptide (TPR) repeat protein
MAQGKTASNKKKNTHTIATSSPGPKKHSIDLIPSWITSRWVLPALLLITFLCFLPSLWAGFVNWDDGDYTYENTFIRSLFNPELLTRTVQGNYHPLTMISLAINYAISGDEPWSYHLFNLIFHLINCVLVFRLALRLSNNNRFVAIITTLLFGIHPMHVESVAWVSERKDVLYSIFFLAGLNAYTRYIDERSTKHYFFAILWLVISLLSKPAAVIFPVALFSIDILRKRKIHGRLLLEKTPFFVLSFAMGVATYILQKKAGAVGGLGYTTLHTILFGFYGIALYFIKAALPFQLSPFYPFPTIGIDLPAGYYLAPFFCIALGYWFIRSLKGNRIAAFGLAFFVINLLLVLQFLTVGSAIIAERYTYIPYIGLFFILASWISAKAKEGKLIPGFFLFPVTVILCLLTFKQTLVWHDGSTLWASAIKTHPSARAYNNRGNLLLEEKNYDAAFECFTKAIELNAVDDEAYASRGNIYFNTGKVDQAIADYRKSLAYKPKSASTLDNLGVALLAKQQFDSALIYFNKALSVDPDFNPSYRNRGYVYFQRRDYTSAIKDYEKFFVYVQDNAEVYNLAGTCYRELKLLPASLKAISKAIELQAQGNFYLNRSVTYRSLGDLTKARQDAIIAKSKGSVVDPAYEKSVGMGL